MNFVKTISTELDKLNRRVIKYLRLGKSNVQTSLQSAPYGIDSNPVKDMIAIYGETGQKGKTVVIGYLNKSVLAGIGETRMFSTDSGGALKTFIWLKNDGTMQIGGSAKNMVRYQELETGFNTLKTDVNNLITAFNAHMHATAGTGPPVPPTPGAGIPATASTASITGAKIDEIKTL